MNDPTQKPFNNPCLTQMARESEPLSDQIESLLHAYIDGSITIEQRLELEAVLTQDKTARQRLVDYLALDSALIADCFVTATETESELMSILPSVSAAEHVSNRSLHRSFRSTTNWGSNNRYWWLSAAATILLVIGWSLFNERPSSFNQAPDRAVVWAEIMEVNQARFASSTASWRTGDRLQLTDLAIESGNVDLKLDSGVTLSLEGPFKAHFENATTLRLIEGRMSAEVSEAGKGFTVRTAESEVVDLGTRFGISANSNGETDVVVFEGEVKVRRHNPQTKSEAWTTLRSGEAVRVQQKQKELQRLARVRLSKNRKLWSTQSSSPSSLVVDVEDNATEPEFLHYLGVVAQGMGVDAQPFSDRPTAKWQAIPGSEFPSELESIDLVRTFLADRGDRDLEIRIKVSQPCILYVMHDDRRPEPSWLEKEFLKTNWKIRVGPWPATMAKDIQPDPNGKLFIPCSVWKCRVDRAGDIVLGSPFVKGSKGQGLMYAIAVGPVANPPVQITSHQ